MHKNKNVIIRGETVSVDSIELDKYREFLTQDDAQDFQKNVYGEYCERYKEIQTKFKKRIGNYKYSHFENAIFEYLGDSYYVINKFLESYDEKKTDNQVQLKVIADKINELIIGAPTIPEDIVVYRAVDDREINFLFEQINNYDNKCTINKYLSTSLRQEKVIDLYPSRNHILKIYVPSGTYALAADTIKNRAEEEILFPPGQRLYYLDKKDGKHGKIIYSFIAYDSGLPSN